MMKTMTILLPFVLSFLAGSLFLSFLWKGKKPLPYGLYIILSLGTGLGLSSFMSFASFVVFNRHLAMFSLTLHLIWIIFFLSLNFINTRKTLKEISYPQLFLELMIYGGLALLLIPLWKQARFYPYGGWDAWSVWNFKAKFLLLAGKEWQNLFDPILWRASPHYPLLLPLINLWGWSFLKGPIPLIPIIVSMIFTSLTGFLLYAALRTTGQRLLMAGAAVLLLSLPFFGTLATSQYSDIVMAYFLLSSLFCFMQVNKENNPSFTILGAMNLGFLSFTKPEGLVAALLITAIILISLAIKHRRNIFDIRASPFILLIAALFISFLPTLIFNIFYSPGNQTFINGFSSPEHPVTLYRLKMILAFFLVELKSSKWNGLWILILVGLLTGRKKCFKPEILIWPVFLLGYLGIIIIYYLTNTYFEIQWWLSVTLNRILFSLLPLALFWIFSSLGMDGKKEEN